MKNRLLKQRTTNAAFVLAAMLVAAFTAAASPQPENLLLSAGFKAKVAITSKQKQELKTLSEGEVSLVMQKGKTFYIYPDASRNQIYVGGEAQYQALKNLLAQQPNSTGPFVFRDEIAGHDVPVKEFFGWAPFREF